MRTERVTADKLRPGDRLVLPSGRSYELLRVQHGVERMTLTLEETKWEGGRSGAFVVPVGCHFTRVHVDKTINTRPDLVSADV